MEFLRTTALLPVFFVLALGYVAGKRHAFDAEQATGLSELALGFALPASLFVGMTEIPKELLLQQGQWLVSETNMGRFELLLMISPPQPHCLGRLKLTRRRFDVLGRRGEPVANDTQGGD
jgi:hypothetical protein